MNNRVLAVIVVIALLVIGGIIIAKNSGDQMSNQQGNVGIIPNEQTSTTTPGTSTTTPQTGTTTPQTQVKEFTVTASNFKFLPATMTVKKGDTVKIVFKNDSGFHDLKIDAFNATTKQLQAGSQETIQFVADKTGTFEYYCSVGTHRQMGMKGSLIVQ